MHAPSAAVRGGLPATPSFALRTPATTRRALGGPLGTSRRHAVACAVRDQDPQRPSTSDSGTPADVEVSRRTMHIVGGVSLASLAAAKPSQASKLGALDGAWEAVGGGPADLYFPEQFLGTWEVTSVLTSVELPMGEGYVPNMAVVNRAKQEDQGKPLYYQVSFTRNSQGKVITDRRFNTAALMSTYYGPKYDYGSRIVWNPDDPNTLRLSMPGGMAINTRVTRRSAAEPGDSRLDTSEYFENLFDNPASPPAKLKASQCFTKYRWRPKELAAGGPEIVATQVVGDFLTPYDGEELYMKASNKPVTLYTYKMTFTRAKASA